MTIKASKGLALLPPPFDTLPDFDQTLLKQSGSIRQVPKGDAILNLGDVSRDAFVLQSGWCSVSLGGTVTEILSPGSAFFASLYDGVPAWAEVITLCKAVLICLELKTLRTVLERHPRLALMFLEGAMQRLQRAHTFYALKGSQALEHRLADILWHIGSDTSDGSRVVPTSMTQTVLASLLGVPREEVNRKRQLLVKTGYLYEVDKQWRMDAMTPLLLSNMSASLTGQRVR
jgi:CRP-like cAMP-binding protein